MVVRCRRTGLGVSACAPMRACVCELPGELVKRRPDVYGERLYCPRLRDLHVVRESFLVQTIVLLIASSSADAARSHFVQHADQQRVPDNADLPIIVSTPRMERLQSLLQ